MDVESKIRDSRLKYKCPENEQKNKTKNKPVLAKFMRPDSKSFFLFSYFKFKFILIKMSQSRVRKSAAERRNRRLGAESSDEDTEFNQQQRNERGIIQTFKKKLDGSSGMNRENGRLETITKSRRTEPAPSSETGTSANKKDVLKSVHYDTSESELSEVEETEDGSIRDPKTGKMVRWARERRKALVPRYHTDDWHPSKASEFGSVYEAVFDKGTQMAVMVFSHLPIDTSAIKPMIEPKTDENHQPLPFSAQDRAIVVEKRRRLEAEKVEGDQSFREADAAMGLLIRLKCNASTQFPFFGEGTATMHRFREPRHKFLVEDEIHALADGDLTFAASLASQYGTRHKTEEDWEHRKNTLVKTLEADYAAERAKYGDDTRAWRKPGAKYAIAKRHEEQMLAFTTAMDEALNAIAEERKQEKASVETMIRKIQMQPIPTGDEELIFAARRFIMNGDDNADDASFEWTDALGPTDIAVWHASNSKQVKKEEAIKNQKNMKRALDAATKYTPPQHDDEANVTDVDGSDLEAPSLELKRGYRTLPFSPSVDLMTSITKPCARRSNVKSPYNRYVNICNVFRNVQGSFWKMEGAKELTQNLYPNALQIFNPVTLSSVPVEMYAAMDLVFFPKAMVLYDDDLFHMIRVDRFPSKENFRQWAAEEFQAHEFIFRKHHPTVEKTIVFLVQHLKVESNMFCNLFSVLVMSADGTIAQ